MGAVLTQDSTLTCGPATVTPPAHGGAIVQTLGAKLTVGKKAVAVCLASAAGSYTITTGTCANPIAPTNPSGLKCLSVSGASAGASKKLMVGGVPVLLDTVNGLGVSSGTPPGVASAQATQTKLTAS